MTRPAEQQRRMARLYADYFHRGGAALPGSGDLADLWRILTVAPGEELRLIGKRNDNPKVARYRNGLRPVSLTPIELGRPETWV